MNNNNNDNKKLLKIKIDIMRINNWTKNINGISLNDQAMRVITDKYTIWHLSYFKEIVFSSYCLLTKQIYGKSKAIKPSNHRYLL